MIASRAHQTVHFSELPDRPIPEVSLASCDELQEVHILLLNFMRLPRSLEDLLSSITSRKLQKISLTFMDIVDDDDSDEEYEPSFSEDEDGGERSGGKIAWNSLDAVLSRLAQQVHNIEIKLTLQLNIRLLGPEPFKFDHLVPKFLAHGGLVDLNYGDGPTPTA